MLRLGRRIADAVAVGAGVLVTAALRRHRSDRGPRRPRHRRHRGGAGRAEDARERHRRALHHLRQGGARRRLPQARRHRRAPSTTSACVRRASARWIAPSSACPTARSRTRTSRRCRRATSSGFIISSGCATRRPPRRCDAVVDRPSRLSRRPSDDRSHRVDPRAVRSASAPSRSTSRCSRTSTRVDWEAFLETQQEVLLEVMGIIERSGTRIAFPSQTLYSLTLRTLRRRPAGRFDAPRSWAG